MIQIEDVLQLNDLDRSAIDRLRNALNQWVSYQQQTNHRGMFALDVLLTLIAIGVVNRDGNLKALLEAFRSAVTSILPQALEEGAELSEKLRQLIDRYPIEQPEFDQFTWWEPGNTVSYPLRIVLVDRKTGEAQLALLYDESIEIGGVQHNRDLLLQGQRKPGEGWQYRMVVLEN